MTGILAWLFPPQPSYAEVRAEVWSLGARHLGDALWGARQELDAPDITSSRAFLLRACVRKLEGRV